MPELTDHRLPAWLRMSTAPPPADAVIVGGRSCRSRPGLLAEWTAALRPADPPGPDWDALGEMLRERACDGGLTGYRRGERRTPARPRNPRRSLRRSSHFSTTSPTTREPRCGSCCGPGARASTSCGGGFVMALPPGSCPNENEEMSRQ